jgi:hypothetical protein
MLEALRAAHTRRSTICDGSNDMIFQDGEVARPRGDGAKHYRTLIYKHFLAARVAGM